MFDTIILIRSCLSHLDSIYVKHVLPQKCRYIRQFITTAGRVRDSLPWLDRDSCKGKKNAFARTRWQKIGALRLFKKPAAYETFFFPSKYARADRKSVV